MTCWVRSLIDLLRDTGLQCCERGEVWEHPLLNSPASDVRRGLNGKAISSTDTHLGKPFVSHEITLESPGAIVCLGRVAVGLGDQCKIHKINPYLWGASVALVWQQYTRSVGCKLCPARGGCVDDGGYR